MNPRPARHLLLVAASRLGASGRLGTSGGGSGSSAGSPAGAAAASAAGAASASSDLSADGATIVAIVRSSSCVCTVTPSGSLIDEMWTVSPMSRPVRSTVIWSGICSAGQLRSTVWCTMLSTPPRLRPGLSSWLMKSTCDLDVELGVGADAQEVDVQREVLHRIELVVARDDAVLLAVDVEGDDVGEEAAGIDALHAHPCTRSRSATGGLLVAVDDGGDEPLTTQCTSGPLAHPVRA